VVSLLRANGFEVNDLGRDVPVDRFIRKRKPLAADVIGTSALLTTTMTVQKDLEEKIGAEGFKGKIQDIVGGCTGYRAWAKRIGADAYAADATDGVRKIKELLGKVI